MTHIVRCVMIIWREKICNIQFADAILIFRNSDACNVNQ